MPPADRAPSAAASSSRRTPRLLLILAGALLVARVGTGLWESRHSSEVEDRIAWRAIAAGEAEAQKTGKPILYDFTADWCPPCRLMRREVFADEKSAATIEAMFVPIQVVDRAREEGHNPPEVDALQRRFAVDGFPTLVVVSPAGGQPVVLGGYGGKAKTVADLIEAALRTRGESRPGSSAPLEADSSGAAADSTE